MDFAVIVTVVKKVDGSLVTQTEELDQEESYMVDINQAIRNEKDPIEAISQLLNTGGDLIRNEHPIRAINALGPFDKRVPDRP